MTTMFLREPTRHQCKQGL